MKKWLWILCICVLFPVLTFAAPPYDAAPPSVPVKLIFIHHSTGGNWLADPNNEQPAGGLGQALMDNNYFVSATNYGWGPNSIGDRTDIVYWPEWFIGPQRDTYLDALYNETAQNVGDFGAWSRLASAPGGENTIIMFKSCFPNSDLYGNPNDPPGTELNDWEYSVGHAKAIYNALLGYFETRQDKLFIVITAPPLMADETEAARADNARAFNTWLVTEWLRDYAYANVAVFDYYNVLTAPDNHHRWNANAIEHVQAADNNFAYYPSGDSHPSSEGHSKATEEFVPLLNVFYNRWQAGEVVPPPPPEPTEEAAPETAPEVMDEPPDEETDAEPPEPTLFSDIHIDDFEAPLEWYPDIGEGATIACEPDAGALRIAYTIPVGSWGGCGRYFNTAQDWRTGNGLTFRVRADEAERWFTLALFSGDLDNPTPFEIMLDAEAEWGFITLPWDDIGRAEWADAEGLQSIDPARITGIGFSVGDGEGNIWVDDLALLSGEILQAPALPEVEPSAEEPVAPATEEPTASEEPEEPENAGAAANGGGGLCASAPLALSLSLVGVVLGRKRKQPHL